MERGERWLFRWEYNAAGRWIIARLFDGANRGWRAATAGAWGRWIADFCKEQVLSTSLRLRLGVTLLCE